METEDMDLSTYVLHMKILMQERYLTWSTKYKSAHRTVRKVDLKHFYEA